MSRRVDERAVTVQIGAVLMLAILVSALALYQVSAVPDQNHETEFTHNERVAGELVELRDTIRNAGSERLEGGVPITLGAQYQTRTVAINPPAPSGRLSTSDPRPVKVENVTIEEGDPDGTIQDVLDDPPTTRLLTYDPRYNEYRGPTTRIEHSLLYNEFGAANVTLEEQTMLDDDSVTLVFLEGSLSRSTTGTVSVDVETIGGPTGESKFESNGSGNVTITLPTDSPERWEAALGTTFEGSPQENARIRNSDHQNVTIELANETYDLRLAQVSVGDGSTPDSRFDDARAPASEKGSGTFTVEWDSDAETIQEGQTERIDVHVTDDQTGDPIADVAVDFARRGGGSVSFSGDTQADTDETGTASIDVTGESAGETTIFASTVSGTDRLLVTVDPFEPPADGPYFDVQITQTNSPVTEGETVTVDATIENRGTQPDTQTIQLVASDGVELDSQTVSLESGEQSTITLEWDTTADDAGDQTIRVSTDDESDQTTVRVERNSGATGPTVDSFDTSEQPGNNAGIRYSWAVSAGDAELESAVVELHRDRTPVDRHTHPLSGQNGGSNNEKFADLGNGQEYTLRLTVTDTNGNTAEAVETQIAG
ncbi:CARDB domain-containing protein [Halomontanus rarus]|uniref:CARDB domain-containing protein n=1 Tax=Halomontanus rarus TaxID=3034020 RepID=UPI0023E8AFA8|nr:CARDB domain-containing protein [Halovivax sp. TS33]